MSSSIRLPDLLVFGAQSELPSDEALEDLRQELITNTRLSALREAVADLPRFWGSLVRSDPILDQLPGAEYLGLLAQWVREGGVFPGRQDNLPNHYIMPLTVLLQMSQYARYLSHFGEGAHEQVLTGVQTGGIQGFCVGFLSAAAVATSRTEADLGSAAAVGLRLAVCVGAYADVDGVFDRHGHRTVCVAIRWEEGKEEQEAEVAAIMRAFSGAYISSFNDAASVTATLLAGDLDPFVLRLRSAGLRATVVPVRGRFHHATHAEAVEKLAKLALQSEELSYPAVASPLAPMRSTGDGSLIAEGSLTRAALEAVLLKPAQWYKTMREAVAQMPKSRPTVAVFVGYGNHIPASLSRGPSLHVHVVSNSTAIDSGSQPPNGSHGTRGIKGGNGITDLGGRGDTSRAAGENSWVSKQPAHSIAIVGMAGRFPGADSVDELWGLLAEGRVAVERAPERLRLPQTGDYADTQWWGNFVRDVDAFDHRFFRKSSREALACDPQQRLLLEVVYAALESAGHFGPAAVPPPADVGCYIGAVSSNYADNVVCHTPSAYNTTGTTRSFLSGQVSHHFGWTGPALTIDTACSASLVAINTACRAIWTGECTRAVAGGTNILSSPFDYQNLAAAGFLSPTGQCKPFDAAGDGYCRAEGVAVVYLKPLADAVKDHDNILGVILGSAANQNHGGGHIAAPQTASQTALYRKTMELAGVSPEAVSYVEAHGTGTGVGDPVEVASIREAFGGPQRRSTLHFGSIKGNLGHSEATAGVAGLIKVLLQMKNGKIPMQASHNTLNPKIPPLERDQMVIPRSLLPWDAPNRLACVTSYGAAGSNSAVLLGDGPPKRTTRRPPALPSYPLFISAASENSLSAYCTKLLELLEVAKDRGDADIVPSLTFSLADRANHVLQCVLSTSVDSVEDLKTRLEAASRGFGIATTPAPKPVVMVFGGQESDFVGVSEAVYRSSTVFRGHLDFCNEFLVSKGLESFYPSIFQTEAIEDIVTLHSALFAVQYASAATWIDCGLKVDAVVGHSFGQLTAFCVSGALSLSDALELIVGRASLMKKYWGPEPGSMLFIEADRQTVERTLESLRSGVPDQYAEVACYNGPQNHVVVGSSQSIDALEQHICTSPSFQSSVRTKRLAVTQGFHSRYTEAMLPHLADLARKLEWKRPHIHLETCEELGSTYEPDFKIVAEHTRRPVFFQQAIQRLGQKFPESNWIEAGRGSFVIQLVRGSTSDKNTFISPQLTSPKAQASLIQATLDLWRNGCATQYWMFHRLQKDDYGSISLPPYQFEKTRHWLPFTGCMREPTAETEPANPEEKTHELLRFLRFTDHSKTEAVFRIDPQADRFQTILRGHVMTGRAMTPASLSFEMVARAALFLQNDLEAVTYVPTVEELIMKAPIGQDTDKEILLTLKSMGNARPSWSFSITTRTTGAQTEPSEHTTGQVYLKRRDDARSAREFSRFECLVGLRRCNEIINHPEAETMQGKHIYRAFSTVVNYGEVFRGIKKVSCVDHEAAGIVVMTPDPHDPPDQRLCDTPMTDSFMQFAGFLANYFSNENTAEFFVCHKIDHIELGGLFSPDMREWSVYATMSAQAEKSVDAYVFETATGKMVMAVFGLRFARLSQEALNGILRAVSTTSAGTERSSPPVAKASTSTEKLPLSASTTATLAETPASKRNQLFQVLADVTDTPLADIKEDTTLEELGIDSLMATEVLNDVRSVLGLTIDVSTFLFFPNVQAMVVYVDEKFGVGKEGTPENSASSQGADTPASGSDVGASGHVANLQPSLGPTIKSAIGAFKETRLTYDRLAEETKAVGFWEQAYPHQARLILAYVVEALAQLGCDLKTLSEGDFVPQVQVLDKHKQLLRQLYRILEDGKLVKPGGLYRSNVPVDPTPAETIYQQIIDMYPQHANVNRLLRVTGSQMDACLTGAKDGIQLIFGDRQTKETMEALYEFWPLLRAPTLLLSDFLVKVLSRATGPGTFRILEVGAGTGGTTRHLVKELRRCGIPFEYTYTDISASLVAAARKQFGGADDMRFELLDVEKPGPAKHEGAFHCIVSTNCIHATRDLDVSLHHLRRMLRPDGVLALIECTENMFWLDMTFGLLDGWWAFADGRTHALVDETQWQGRMRAAGFDEVLWSDGDVPEARSVRVIAAFPGKEHAAPPATPARTQVHAAIETVVYKTAGDAAIEADIYYPVDGELPREKMPIALMMHGGSHMLFSRKDVRPAQTRLLLQMGFLPVSLDYRLCPEVTLAEGPMADVCDALAWARSVLPNLPLPRRGLSIDGDRVVAVGWSSGGQLAMSLAWTAPARGLRPPAAILAFYSPTDYEDAWWRAPIVPRGVADDGRAYDVLEGVQDAPLTAYSLVGAWEPLADPRVVTDARCRLVLHINWHAQTLPLLLGGLPSRARADPSVDWHRLPQPDPVAVRAVSPRAHIAQGTYRTPTFLVHGTADDLIPWQQTQATYAAMVAAGVEAGLALVDDAPHICDQSSDPASAGWQAARRGYEFLGAFA